jgi:hypothetical protein
LKEHKRGLDNIVGEVGHEVGSDAAHHSGVPAGEFGEGLFVLNGEKIGYEFPVGPGGKRFEQVNGGSQHGGTPGIRIREVPAEGGKWVKNLSRLTYLNPSA